MSGSDARSQAKKAPKPGPKVTPVDGGYSYVSIPATVGAVVVLYGPRPWLPTPARRTVLSKDRFGGRLSVEPKTRFVDQLWEIAQKCIKPCPVRVNEYFVPQSVFRYEVNSSWSWGFDWTYWPSHIARLIVYSLLVEGPVSAEFDQLLFARVSAKDVGDSGYTPGLRVWSNRHSYRGEPSLYFPYGTIYATEQRSWSGVGRCFARLAAQFAKPELADPRRWQSKSRAQSFGSRLERSLEFFLQGNSFLEPYEGVLKAHIAFEVLFEPHLNNQSAMTVLCPLLLRESHDPKVVRDWVRELYSFRNELMHGKLTARHRLLAKPSSPKKDAAVEAAQRLLPALYRRIVHDDVLLQLFSGEMNPGRFSDGLFDAAFPPLKR